MSRLAELLPRADTAVAPEDLQAAERELGTSLPDDLREFLIVSDGSPWMDFPEFGFQVLSLEDTMGLWALPEEDRSGPQRLVDVASDGSRERFCFDPLAEAIVWLNIVGDEPPVVCAPTLTALVEQLSAGWNPFDLRD